MLLLEIKSPVDTGTLSFSCSPDFIISDGFKLAKILTFDSKSFADVNVLRADDLPYVTVERRDILGNENAFSISQTLSAFEVSFSVRLVNSIVSCLIGVDDAVAGSSVGFFRFIILMGSKSRRLSSGTCNGSSDSFFDTVRCRLGLSLLSWLDCCLLFSLNVDFASILALRFTVCFLVST